MPNSKIFSANADDLSVLNSKKCDNLIEQSKKEGQESFHGESTPPGNFSTL